MISNNNVELVDKIVYKSVYSIIFQSKSKIQSIQSRFKSIRFIDSKKS